MRTLLLFMLLFVSSVSAARKMIVVVYSTDRVVVDYICGSRAIYDVRVSPGVIDNGIVAASDRVREPVISSSAAGAIRTVVKRPGRMNWHVVNGVGPFTVIDKQVDQFGNVCITVLDAAGNMATGCSVMGEKRYTEFVDCEAPRNSDDPYSSSDGGSVHAADVKENRPARKPDYRGPGWNEPRPRHDPTTRAPVVRTRTDGTTTPRPAPRPTPRAPENRQGRDVGTGTVGGTGGGANGGATRMNSTFRSR